MSRWLGWRWEFDGSNSTRAGNGGGGLWSPVDCFGVGGATIAEGRTSCEATTEGWFVESCGLFCCGQGNDCFGEGRGVEGRERAGKSGRGNDYGKGKTGWKNEKAREGKKQKVKFSFQPFYSSKTSKTNRVNWITDLTVGTSDLRLV